MKTFLTWCALLGGEAVIVASFLLWGDSLPTELRILNIAVSMFVYGLLFIDLLAPWIDRNDRSQRKVGSLGLRWVVTWLYAATAVLLMIGCNAVFETPIALQIILHCIAILLLVLGFSAALHASGKVAEVHAEETARRSGLLELKQAVRRLQNTLGDTPGLPDDYGKQAAALAGELRYIAPSDTAEARALEQELAGVLERIVRMLPDYAMHREALDACFRKAARLCEERKSVYSN